MSSENPQIVTAQPEAAPVVPVETVPEVVAEPTPKTPAPDLTTSDEIEDRFLTTEEQERLFSGLSIDPVEDAPKPPSQEDILKDLFKDSAIDPEMTAVTPVPVVETQKQEVPTPVPGQTPAAVPQPVPATPLAPLVPPGPPVQQTPAEAALSAQIQLQSANVQRLEGQIQEMMGKTPAITPEQQQVQQQQQAPQQQFNFNVPDEYMTALASDDIAQRKAALNGLLSGVAEVAYQRAGQDLTKQMETVPQTIRDQQDQQQERQKIHDDMYKTYPELVGWEQQVAATANQVAGEMNTTQWTPQVRDEVARRLAPLAPGLAQRLAQAQPVPQIPQALPQGTVQPQVPAAAAPIPQHYTSVQGMPAHQVQVAPAATTPQLTLVRQPDGTIVSVPVQGTQQYAATPGTRPNGSIGVSDEIQDIWATLGYA